VVVAASPASNSTVGGTVTRVEIAFNEIVSNAAITISGPVGPIAADTIVNSGQVISASFPPFTTEGRYVVRFAVISADTDRVDGAFAFTYRQGAPDPLPIVAPMLAGDEGRSPLVVALLAAGLVLVMIGVVQAVVRTRRLRQLTSSKRVPSDG
jgi:methionine-rich copper-binding protein CopC